VIDHATANPTTNTLITMTTVTIQLLIAQGDLKDRLMLAVRSVGRPQMRQQLVLANC
jgi:hypothetical protein